ncbi:hypothetical protein [Geminicoccus roseus]|uniref:hypothetical protein n=1 Tax=Geminicoccus roseus TaxID=404900 RepID=UPI000411B9CE|nr:hypothetical protein [Geminicoccus roseus]
MIRALLLGAVLLLPLPAAAQDSGPDRSADELEKAIEGIRAKVEAQRAATGRTAGDAAERSAELDRLVGHLAALEGENEGLRERNGQLEQDLEEAVRKAARLEEEVRSLAELSKARLDGVPAAVEQLAEARAELERISGLLGGLEAGHAVLSAVAEGEMLQVEPPPGADETAGLRAELAAARARIAELEARAP